LQLLVAISDSGVAPANDKIEHEPTGEDRGWEFNEERFFMNLTELKALRDSVLGEQGAEEQERERSIQQQRQRTKQTNHEEKQKQLARKGSKVDERHAYVSFTHMPKQKRQRDSGTARTAHRQPHSFSQASSTVEHGASFSSASSSSCAQIAATDPSPLPTSTTAAPTSLLAHPLARADINESMNVHDRKVRQAGN
jgi:hypothetical protein